MRRISRVTALVRAPLMAFVVLTACTTTTGSRDTETPPPLEEPPDGSGKVMPASSAKVEQAMDLIRDKDFARAKALLSQAQTENPKDAQAAYYMGVALEGLGDVPHAMEEYRKALTLDSKLVEASVNLSALLLDAQDAKGALEIIERARPANPQHPGLLMNRALALEAIGDRAGAVQAYGDAVKAAPDNAELRYAHAELLAESGKKTEALEELRKAVNTDDPKVLGASSSLFGKLQDYSDCVSVLDRVLKSQANPDNFVRRGVCRHGMNDEAGARADFESALKLDQNYAPAHYYLGQHHRAKGENAEALTEFKRAAELGKDTPMAKAAQRAIEELSAPANDKKGGSKKK